MPTVCAGGATDTYTLFEAPISRLACQLSRQMFGALTKQTLTKAVASNVDLCIHRKGLHTSRGSAASDPTAAVSRYPNRFRNIRKQRFSLLEKMGRGVRRGGGGGGEQKANKRKVINYLH